MKQIKGLSIGLDDSNPDTPKIVNPITGQAQRATYTDVLLFTLIERIESLTESMREKNKGSDRPPTPILTENTAPDITPEEGEKPPTRRTSTRTKRVPAEADS